MKRLQIKYRALLGILIFYIPFHICLSPNYWDDKGFAQILSKYDNSLVQYTIARYSIWSSRITIELVVPILAMLPSVVWKCLNLLVIVLLYRELIWMLEHIFELRGNSVYYVTAVLLCAFPFSIMAQTGWIATTTNYLWVLAFGLYAINRMLKGGLLGIRLSRQEMICAALAVCYSASFESMAAILFLIEMGLLVYCKKSGKKCPAVVWMCMGMTAIFLVYILCCPGNRLRPIRDAQYWMPDYFELTLLDKLRMGILSSYMHFVSLPSPVFFIFNVIIFLMWKGESAGKRIMAALPVFTDVAWTGWFMINYLLGWRTLTYQVPTPLPKRFSEWVEQGLLLVTVALWFAVVLYTLITKVKKGWFAVIILILACLPEMAVGLTPTVVASILRTMIYLYMAMILLILIMAENEAGKWPAVSRRFIYLCMLMGVILNACQITRHILLYG